MLDLQLLRDHPDRVRTAIEHKGMGAPDDVTTARALDEQHRKLLTELQQAQARSNTLSKAVGEKMRAGEREAAQPLIQESGTLKQRIQELEEDVSAKAEALKGLLLSLPNVPHESVPVGQSPNDNEVVFTSGEKPTFSFEAQPHWELLERHGLADFERGAKVTGAGFPFYTGRGARLQRGLIHFFLDLATDRGYREMQPPLFVNEASATGTGQLPDKEDIMYEIDRDGLFPIPTAEVPVTNYFRDEILSEDDLPIKFCAYTPCFRREAGSHGKDVRALNRLHQFDKVELVQFVKPSESYEALEAMRADAEHPLKLLGLPYRRLLMCTGDMGFTQTKKYDLEVWSAGQKRWLEVSSISNFEAFQARRTQVRYRDESTGSNHHVHTLNGSALALPRVVAALLEHYQQRDGTIALPEVLHQYTGFGAIG